MLRYMIIIAMSLSACSTSSSNDWPPIDHNPEGSYRTSCSECVTQEGVLSCASCLDGQGRSVESVLALAECRATVVNCLGVLECDECEADREPPQCTTDGDCADQCVDCFQCRGGHCICGYREFPASCGP